MHNITCPVLSMSAAEEDRRPAYLQGIMDYLAHTRERGIQNLNQGGIEIKQLERPPILLIQTWII